MNNKGITLVSLVITIIVMLILAGVSLSMVLGDGSVLDQAKNASTATVLASIKEEFELNKTGRKMQELVKNNGKQDKGKEVVNPDGTTSLVKDTGIYAFGEEVKEYIPNIDKGYIGKVGIFNDELIFIDENLTEEDKAYAEGSGFTIMNDDDYTYMALMKKMEKLVLASTSKPGTNLTSTTALTIAGLKYGASWCKVTADQLDDLGFTSEEVSVFSQYAPFAVRYTTGELLSQKGRLMYAGTDKEIPKYTFNYYGEKDGVVVTDLMAGVDSSSTKTTSEYGAFKPSNGSFVLDETDHNALVFEGDSNKTPLGPIGELAIDQSLSINKVYSLGVTVKCDVNQVGEMLDNSYKSIFPDQLNSYHRAIISISDAAGQYVCWMGVDRGFLRIYNFRDSAGATSWASQPNGYMSYDVREYDGKYMNIQFVAEKGGDAKLYINGELKKTGKAGTKDFSYKTLTIGDLRKDRGLLYQGRLYNVLIYGRAITDAEVNQNYNAVRKELNF